MYILRAACIQMVRALRALLKHGKEHAECRHDLEDLEHLLLKIQRAEAARRPPGEPILSAQGLSLSDSPVGVESASPEGAPSQTGEEVAASLAAKLRHAGYRVHEDGRILPLTVEAAEIVTETGGELDLDGRLVAVPLLDADEEVRARGLAIVESLERSGVDLAEMGLELDEDGEPVPLTDCE